MRKISARTNLKPDMYTAKANNEFQLTATLEFITPMFGGGVRIDPQATHHKAPDPVTPVRGASLRGQLRTWWRRTCAQGLSLEQMQARERVLWGWASTRGAVSLAVLGQPQVKPRPVYELDDKGRVRPIGGFGAPLAYGAFPLQPAQGAQDKSPGVLTSAVGTFQVSLRLEAQETSQDAREAWPRVQASDLKKTMWAEVRLAWRAFATFGGLGGRTRRGFGAVRVVDADEPVVLKDVIDELGWAERVVMVEQPDADKAQAFCLSKLRDFRQSVGFARNQGADHKKPGRSRWPEPDQIRRLTHRWDPTHAPQSATRKFPRAAFGMPIIFHFQSKTDPGDTSLQPKDRERLASPLIVRPVRDASVTYAVALRLPDERGVLGSLSLRQGNHEVSGASALLTGDEAASVRPLKGQTDVLAAFLKYFTNR